MICIYQYENYPGSQKREYTEVLMAALLCLLDLSADYSIVTYNILETLTASYQG